MYIYIVSYELGRNIFQRWLATADMVCWNIIHLVRGFSQLETFICKEIPSAMFDYHRVKPIMQIPLRSMKSVSLPVFSCYARLLRLNRVQTTLHTLPYIYFITTTASTTAPPTRPPPTRPPTTTTAAAATATATASYCYCYSTAAATAAATATATTLLRLLLILVLLLLLPFLPKY